MTMSRKNSRPIEVDGRHYRWMVKRCRGPVGTKPTVRLTVEDRTTGDYFQKDFPEIYKLDDCGDVVGLDNRVTSGDVREFIRSLDKPCRK
jgi:hypothetical protein